MALEQVDEALSWGVPRFVVLADSGFGTGQEFRTGLRQRGLPYVVRIEGKTGVWAPGTGPIPPERRAKPAVGRPPHRWQDGDQKPLSALELVTQLGRAACRTVCWAEGSRGPQQGLFHAVRVRTSRHHDRGAPPGPEEWLLYEWRDDDDPRIWLSSLPADLPLERLVYLAKLRWRIERDYQELKGELGLDHFEGRTWQGFHHHATLCLLAHAFLAIQRTRFPLRAQRWTLPQVRAALHPVLMHLLGHCPLCRRPIRRARRRDRAALGPPT
jgi:SRSO17 transposase